MIRVPLIVAAYLLACHNAALAECSPPALPDAPQRVLVAGDSFDATIHGGECHRLVVGAAPNLLEIRIEQRGIDITMIIHSGDSSRRINTPVGPLLYESALLRSSSEPVAVDIEAAGNAKAGGSYLTTIAALDGERPHIERILAAHDLTAQAMAGYAESEHSPKAVARSFQQASDAWITAGNNAEAARLLFSAASVKTDDGDLEAAVSTLREGEALLHLIDDRPLRLRLTLQRALIQLYTGEHVDAERTLHAAIASSDSSTDPAIYAHLHIALGLTFQKRGQLDEARGWYQQASAILRDHPDTGLLAMVSNNLAGIHYELGEPEPAFTHFMQALTAFESAGNDLEWAHARMNMAFLDANIGRFDNALAGFYESLAVFERLRLKSDEARVLHGIGLSYLGLGAYIKARHFFESSLKISEKFPDGFLAIVTMLYLGDVYRRTGDVTAAADIHRNALGISRRSSDRRNVAFASAALGSDFIAAGQPREAAPLLSEARDIFAELGYRRQLADTLQLMAVVLEHAKDRREAIALLQDALKLDADTGNPRGELHTLTALSRLQAIEGDLDAGLTSASRAADILERLRVNISSADLRATFFGSTSDPFSLLVELHMRKHRQNPADGHDIAAFLAAERSRARSLRDTLDRADVDLYARAPPSVRERRRSLQLALDGKLFRIRSLQDAMGHVAPDIGGDAIAIGTSEDKPWPLEAATRDELRSAESDVLRLLGELDALEATITLGDPTSALGSRHTETALHEVRSSIGKEAVLLAYFLAEPSSYLWSVSDSRLISHTLPGRGAIEALGRQAYEALTDWQPLAPDAADAPLRRLAEVILPPGGEFSMHRHLVVIPDGVLNYIPFAALPVHASDEPLVSQHTISYLPAFSLLEPPAARRHLLARKVAVFADPLMASNGRIAAVASRPADSRRGNPESISVFDPISIELWPLPYSRVEAERIRALLPDGMVQLATGAAATKAALLETDLADYGVLHFATHSIVNSGLPELSSLVLSQFAADGLAIDGMLHLADIYNLRIDADLVVLSACRTALGQHIRGEGFLSLSRGFLYAGAASTISSLWNVPDRATADLMRLTYEHMYQRDMSPAEAIREAQRQIRAQKKWRSPFFWAGFFVVDRHAR